MNIDSIIYDLSYDDVINSENRELISRFNELLKEIPYSIFSKYKSLGLMFEEAEYFEESMISSYTFPGEKVKYYPNITYKKSAKPFMCAVSGSIYRASNECVLFKPMFYLPRKKECYVLSKAVRAHYSCEDFFPTRDIKEYDEFAYKVDYAYENGFEEHYNFSCNIKGGLMLRKLNRK